MNLNVDDVTFVRSTMPSIQSMVVLGGFVNPVLILNMVLLIVSRIPEVKKNELLLR